MRDVNTLLDATQHPYRYRRYVAVRDLWRYDGPRCLEAALVALDDPDRRIQLAAIEALGHRLEPRATQALIGLLEHPDAGLRALAARQLGLHPADQIIPPLEMMLTDPDFAVRYQALLALADIDGLVPSEAMLACLTDEERRVRAAAILASSGSHDPRLVAALVHELSEPHSTLFFSDKHHRLAEALRHPDLVPALFELLEHRDDKVILQAVTALSYSLAPDAVEPLSRLLPWRFVPVAVRAGEVLGQMDTPDAIAALMWAAQSPYVSERLAATTGLVAAQHYPPLVSLAADPDMQVSQRAVSGLVYAGAVALTYLIHAVEAMNETQRQAAAPQIARYASSELITALLMPTHDAWERLVALLPLEAVWRSLAAHNAREIDPLPLEVVQLALRHPEPLVRQVGSMMAGRVIADTSVKVELWRMALADDDAVVRGQVVVALQHEPPQGVLDVVRGCLADPSGSVRAVAASVLGKLGDPRAIPALIEALHDPAAAREAASALGELGARQALDALFNAMTSEDVQVRFAAVEAVGKLGEARAVEALVYALRDPDDAVRMKAAEALGRIGDPRAIEFLIKALADPSGRVRGLVAWALGWFADPTSVSALVEALWDEPNASATAHEHPNTAVAILEALMAIGTPDAHEAIAEWQAQHVLAGGGGRAQSV